jgi:hypothetical protein
MSVCSWAITVKDMIKKTEIIVAIASFFILLFLRFASGIQGCSPLLSYNSKMDANIP